MGRGTAGARAGGEADRAEVASACQNVIGLPGARGTIVFVTNEVGLASSPTARRAFIAICWAAAR
jgi:adenosyl cobinamide kinase/adenosyl cobinamide phosphate guanylyltransferase